VGTPQVASQNVDALASNEAVGNRRTVVASHLTSLATQGATLQQSDSVEPRAMPNQLGGQAYFQEDEKRVILIVIVHRGLDSSTATLALNLQMLGLVAAYSTRRTNLQYSFVVHARTLNFRLYSEQAEKRKQNPMYSCFVD
jgi:hypothetical protein